MAEFITIDFGNSIIKTNKRVEFNSQIMITNINEVEFSDAIILNEKCYAIGQGEYENNNVKVDKKYLEQFALYAIVCSTNADEVDVIFNLPVDQLPMKSELIGRLMGKEFTFKVSSNTYKTKLQEKTIKFNRVAVLGESVASYYSLGDELVAFITMLDIGSKNINYATYTEIGKNDLSKSGTLDFGIHDFYQTVISYYQNEKRKMYSISDIDKRVRANKIEIPEELKVEFIEKIKNALQGKGFSDYQDYSIKCVGGGSLVLDKSLTTGFDDAVILSDAVFRNTLGSELVGTTLGFGKNPAKFVSA